MTNYLDILNSILPTEFKNGIGCLEDDIAGIYYAVKAALKNSSITHNGASFAAGLEATFTAAQRDAVIKNDGANDIILYVLDASANTTVEANSGSDQCDKKVLAVAATIGFVAGDTIVIAPNTAFEEIAVINTIQAGVSLTLVSDMAYVHSQATAHKVQKYFNRHTVKTLEIFDESFVDFTKISISAGQALPAIAGRYYTRYGV